jgi:hypothetical protein
VPDQPRQVNVTLTFASTIATRQDAETAAENFLAVTGSMQPGMQIVRAEILPEFQPSEDDA